MSKKTPKGLMYDYQNLNILAKLMDGESLLNLLLSDNPFYRTDICRACGGKCCKISACSAIPEDFKCDMDVIDRCLHTGKYSISYICKKGIIPHVQNDQILITKELLQAGNIVLAVRPRNANAGIIDFSLKPKGPCILWNSENGCTLSGEERPTGAKGLIPIRPGICREIYDYDSFLYRWRPFQNDLIALIGKYK